MSANPRTLLRFLPTFALAAGLAGALGLATLAQGPEPGKKSADVKAGPKDPPVIKLPDGTFLWTGTPIEGTGERVSLTLQELQKLQDQIEQLKKQLALRKPTAPSDCAVRGRVEKRGEQLIAILKLTCTFHTALPQTIVALGGRKGFLFAASLDGKKLPVLDVTDDGFAAIIENAGDHVLTLDLEAPVTSRGAKPELGFEIGLPRAPITTLLLDPPGPDVKRVNLTTRAADLTQPPRPAEPRRIPALDVKQFTSRPGQEGGYTLGAVESMEVTWDPPTTTAQPADQVQSAELDVNVQFTEAVVETTAKIKLRGLAREWRVVALPSADLSVDRASGSADVGPAQPPTITRPTDPNKPVWKIDLSTGSSPADWVITVVTRQPRAKTGDPRRRAPVPIGPFTVLDVLRQTGTVRVTARPHTQFVFTHGPDLRQAPIPGPAEDDVTTAFFRLTSGPSGSTVLNAAPLFTVEARLQPGKVVVKPTYKFSLSRLTPTEDGWNIRAEVRVTPIHTEIDTLAIEFPANWQGLQPSPPELVRGFQQGTIPEGFWMTMAARLAGGVRVPVIVQLTSVHKQPFDLILTATVPVPAGTTEAIIPLPRFPNADEGETAITITVPEGQEVRGEVREWDGEHAATWGTALTPISPSSGKPTRAITALTGKSDRGLARVILGWNPIRPDLGVEVQAEVTLRDNQVEVVEFLKLRSVEGLPRTVRLHGPAGAAGVRASPALDVVKGEWILTIAPDAKEATLKVSYGLALDRRGADSGAWKVPVGLFWPAGATRLESTASIWSSTVTGRTITNLSPAWRELPIEAAPERDALPALTLAASGGETPLMLEARETTEPSAVGVWVDRALVQAWTTDDAATRYRARFLLRRWLVPTVEIRLPGPLAGPTPEFLRDGQKIDVVPISNGEGGDRAFRMPLPDFRSGRPVSIEMRYQLPAARSEVGSATYQPPQFTGAAFAGPVRWQVIVPQGTVPLLIGGTTPELRWRWHSDGVTPGPVGSIEELEQWFRAGDEPAGSDDHGGSQGESITARQSTPTTVTIYRAPRTAFLLVCSSVVLVLCLGLSRLSGATLGPMVGLLGGIAGVAAVFLPHPAAQFAGACQPGLALAAVVLLGQVAVRWYYRRRVTHLPGFSRTRPEPSVHAIPLPSSTRTRPSGVGSTGAVPVAPPGG